MGQVLKDFIERREVSLLGETTPEAFNVLKEVDRGFADLFRVIQVREPTPEVTLEVLIRHVRELEGRHRCRFHPAALPRVIELQRRYARQQAFPGKAAVFLERLAIKHAGQKQAVDADVVLDEFHRTSGLARAFVDDRAQLRRDEVCAALSERLMGQRPAVDALADVVSIGKARLQDPTRPLASCLFLGPTGVGKTQAAKSLARYLLGDEGKLLRFDMNEHGDASAVARLVGTFEQPAGQLTAAVAQNPFAVLLLDEIEKAHPDVFDLLLQVLDDGRLTDSGGHTVDFTGTIIILTSNLGADEAGKAIGFDDAAALDDQVYVKAAERFFRPEFFNRLDRIIPFTRLDRATIGAIADALLDEVLGREGLRRRKSLLDLHPVALERIVELGFHPRLGARALKRALDQQLARPVAAQLSAIAPGRPLLVKVTPAEKEGLEIALQGLTEAERVEVAPAALDFDAPLELIDRLEKIVVRLDEQLRVFEPPSTLEPSAYEISHRVYYALGGLLRDLWTTLEEVRDGLSTPDPTMLRTLSVRDPAKGWLRRWDWSLRLDDLRSVDQLKEYLREIAERTRLAGDDVRDRLLRTVRLLAVIDAMVATGPEGAGEKALLCVAKIGHGRLWYGLSQIRELPLEHATPPGEHPDVADDAKDSGMPGIVAFSHKARCVPFQGPLASGLLEAEAGSHLFWRADGGFSLTIVGVVPLGLGEDPEEVYTRWRDALEGAPLPPIIRLYGPDRRVVDLRTGIVFSGDQEAAPLSPLLQTRWPLPVELEASS